MRSLTLDAGGFTMGAREFTDADERARRVRRVEAVGRAIHGDSWHAPFAETLNEAIGDTKLTRARVAQWMLSSPGAKPVPAWVAAALPGLAAKAAADLRAEADALDALFADDGGEGAPPASGEPEQVQDASQDPGAAALAAADDEFDEDAFIQAVLERGPVSLRREPEPEPEPAPPEGWRSAYAEEYARRRPDLSPFR